MTKLVANVSPYCTEVKTWNVIKTVIQSFSMRLCITLPIESVPFWLDLGDNAVLRFKFALIPAGINECEMYPPYKSHFLFTNNKLLFLYRLLLPPGTSNMYIVMKVCGTF